MKDLLFPETLLKKFYFKIVDGVAIVSQSCREVAFSYLIATVSRLSQPPFNLLDPGSIAKAQPFDLELRDKTKVNGH